MSQPQTLPPLQPQQQSTLPNSNYMNPTYWPTDMSRFMQTSGPALTPDRFAAASHPQYALHNHMSNPPAPPFLSQSGQHYQQPHNYAPTTSGPQSYPQPIAPAPPRDRRPDVSIPTSAFGPGDNRQMWNTTENGTGVPGYASDQTRHVVGSQGRRGILPSAPGREAIVSNGTPPSAKNAAIPPKDENGKFPCQHCNKTYLHAKHLKRHLLRHTGDRPYMCVLCNDTFSRSDILKRHFQKCSVRRGNPEGVSHLSHPHAHRQKQPAGAKGVTDEVHDSQNGANGSYTDGTGNNNTPVTNSFSEAPTVPYTQAPSNGLHRANSDDVYQTESSAANGGWFAKQNPVLYQSAPVSPEHFNMDLSAVGQSKSSSTSGSKQSLTAHHPGEADWNSPFHPVGGESYMNPMFPSSLSSGYDSVPAQSGVKKEVDHHDGAMNGLYVGSTSFGADGTLGPTPWNFDMLQEDPLQIKSDRLVDFCFPGGIQEQLQDPHDSAHLRVCLAADNLRHFLELFTNFQGHFPFIHMPTFKFSEAYDGLILAIACIGAVYSDRVTQVQVRSLMERAKLGIKRTSGVYHVLQPDQSGLNSHMQKPPLTSSSDFEAIQALLALQLLATWHGNTIQRASARADSLHLFRIVRGLGMLSLARPQDGICYSYLHNIQPHEEIVVQKWEWRPWIEQEKRSRVMFLVFLLDAALVIYFNCTPQIDPSELKLPLPCDDAAWEANDAQACANALGLNGAAIRNAVNVTGSQRPKQFELHHALSALHAPTWLFHPRSTNVYSKFILIHALHIQIWHVQRQLSSNVSTLSLENYNVSAGRPYTPLSQHEWIAMDGEVRKALLVGGLSCSAFPSWLMAAPGVICEITRDDGTMGTNMIPQTVEYLWAE